MTGMLSENKLAANQLIPSPLMAMLEWVIEQGCKLFNLEMTHVSWEHIVTSHTDYTEQVD